MKTSRRWVPWVLVGVACAGAIGLAWVRFGHHGDRSARQERLHCALPAQAATHPHGGMVWVPGGQADLGDTVYPEEWPRRKQTVAGFWMDRTEVTNDEFAAFVKATGYTTVAERAVDTTRNPGLSAALQQPGAVVFVMPHEARGGGNLTPWWRYTPGANWRHPAGPQSHIDGRGAFPVVAVTIEDAQAYARWKGRALPSEAQWEWAAQAAGRSARPTLEQPANANTWQGLFPMVNLAEDGFVGLAPVGCYPPNALGLHDMLGNVWELTTDVWVSRPAAGALTSPLPSPETRGDLPLAPRVIKGGSYLCAPNYCRRYRAAARQAQEADLAASHLGFRTILLAPGQ